MKHLFFYTALVFVCDAHSQQYSIDFGTDTGTITCKTPYNGSQQTYCSKDTIVHHPLGYSTNFISSNWYLNSYVSEKCQFALKNPGDTSVGTGTELQFWQDDYPSLKFQVSDFSDSLFKVSFQIKINKPTSLHWSYPSIYFYFGDKKSVSLNTNTIYPCNQYPEDTLIFGSIWFRGDGLLPNNYNALEVLYGPDPISRGLYPNPLLSGINQGLTHSITVYANVTTNSHTYTKNSVTKNLPAHTYHVYYDTLQLHTDILNLFYRGGPIGAFAFYVNEPNYYAPIIVDDIKWTGNLSETLLPVTLAEFTAHACDGAPTACLNWKTETELNNERFVVERSEDGVHFDPVGTVLGSGSTTTPVIYNFKDETAVAGTYYYRLKQVDYDQHYEYSQIVSVEIGEGRTSCDLASSRYQLGVRYVLYDMSGREYCGNASELDIKQLYGMYILRLYQNEVCVCSQKVCFCQ